MDVSQGGSVTVNQTAALPYPATPPAEGGFFDPFEPVPYIDVSQNASASANQSTPSSYPATYTFEGGSSVRLEAVPDPGYRFQSWSGDLSGTTNPATIVMDCNKSITANFTKGGGLQVRLPAVRWPTVNWPVVSWIASCLVLAGLLVTVLILRR